MQIINIMLWVLELLFSLLLITGLFILVYPCSYIAEGIWRGDKLKGIITIVLGPMQFYVTRAENERKEACFSLLGIKLLGIASDKNDKKQKNKKPNNENGDNEKENNEKENNEEEKSIKELLNLLDRGILSPFIELCIKIIRQLKPRYFKIWGRLGFADPYHTGLLAAALAGIPRVEQIEIETDFSGEVRDVMFQVKGRFIIAFLFYYILKVVFTSSLKPVVWTLIKKKTSYRKY